jgi:hypothetical protein
MLFVLDPTIKNIDVDNINHVGGLENIMSAYRKQSHVVYMGMADLNFVMARTKEYLSSAGRAAINSLFNRLPEYKNLALSVDRKVIVYLEGERQKGVFRDANDWYVPLQNFSQFSIIESAILGEDGTDSEMVIVLAEHYIQLSNFNNFVTRARLMNGGGSRTPDTLERYLIDDHSPCLCITDSDKYHPGFRESSTTKKCRDLAKKTSAKVIEHYSLKEREMENLIPLAIVKRVAGNGSFFNIVEGNILNDVSHWSYVDMKEGISHKWIMKQDSPTQQYWKKASKYLKAKIKSCHTCSATGVLEGDVVCDCSRVVGLGNAILANIIAGMKQNQTKLNLRNMSDDVRWQEIAKLTFEFTVAPKVAERAR